MLPTKTQQVRDVPVPAWVMADISFFIGSGGFVFSVNREEEIIVLDRFRVPKAHPCITIERDSWLSFCRILRELQLDTEQPTEESLLPRFGQLPEVVRKLGG
jgi:hypothetical protein